MVEGARLESEYTSKAYRGFESLPLRHPVFYPARTKLRRHFYARNRAFSRLFSLLRYGGESEGGKSQGVSDRFSVGFRCSIVLDERWATNAGRIEHRDPLFAAIREATRQFARDDLLARLEAVGVPVGPINTVAQALNDRQARARGMVIAGERIDGLRTPIRLSHANLALGRPAPRLGERQR